MSNTNKSNDNDEMEEKNQSLKSRMMHWLKNALIIIFVTALTAITINVIVQYDKNYKAVTEISTYLEPCGVEESDLRIISETPSGLTATMKGRGSSLTLNMSSVVGLPFSATGAIDYGDDSPITKMVCVLNEMGLLHNQEFLDDVVDRTFDHDYHLSSGLVVTPSVTEDEFKYRLPGVFSSVEMTDDGLVLQLHR